MFGSLTRTAVAALGMAMLTGAAFADSIDGNWCHNDGRRFSIRGPDIVTPGGKHIEGNYSRHGFSYLAPAPEANEGQTIVMTLANENTVYLRYGETASGAQETWLRCTPSVSSLEVVRRS
jgi:hypothetical protein